MKTHFLTRCLIASLILATCLCGAAPGMVGDSSSDEKHASDLLDEGLLLREWTRNRTWSIVGVNDWEPSMKTFERIVKDYPGTGAADIAECFCIDRLLRNRHLDDAVDVAKSIQAKHPGTTVAAWAQLRIGEVLVKAGVQESENAARELRNVAAMLPDRSDLGPLNESRTVLGRLCDGFTVDDKDVLDAADQLGLDRSDPIVKAQILAVIAAFRGREGKIEKALPLLDRLAWECPGELEAVNWARSRVAISYIQANGCNGEFAPTALEWLSDVPCVAGDDLAAEACLWLARYYCVHGPLSQAVSILEDGKKWFVDTAHGAEILYGLGCVLDRSGKHAEAVAAMRDVIKLKPFAPFYPSLAEFFIAEQGFLGGSNSVVSAMRDAEAKYSPAWRFLTYRPADPLLYPAWMTAAQVVSLIKEGINEEALDIVSALPVSANLSTPELLRARGEVLLCSMRSASTLGRLLDIQPDTVFPLTLPKLDPNDRDSARVRFDLLEAAKQIVAAADGSWCLPEDKSKWLRKLASASRQLGRRDSAIRLYEQVLAMPGTSRDVQAEMEYRIGRLYWDMGQRRSAYSVMQRLSERYSDTTWGEQGRRMMNGWRIVEQLRARKNSGDRTVAD